MECSMCFESLNGADAEVSSTVCGHLFHDVCVRRWLETSDTCPQCRQNTSGAYLRRIFLSTNLENGMAAMCIEEPGRNENGNWNQTVGYSGERFAPIVSTNNRLGRVSAVTAIDDSVIEIPNHVSLIEISSDSMDEFGASRFNNSLNHYLNTSTDGSEIFMDSSYDSFDQMRADVSGSVDDELVVSVNDMVDEIEANDFDDLFEESEGSEGYDLSESTDDCLDIFGDCVSEPDFSLSSDEFIDQVDGGDGLTLEFEFGSDDSD